MEGDVSNENYFSFHEVMLDWAYSEAKSPFWRAAYKELLDKPIREKLHDGNQDLDLEERTRLAEAACRFRRPLINGLGIDGSWKFERKMLDACEMVQLSILPCFSRVYGNIPLGVFA